MLRHGATNVAGNAQATQMNDVSCRVEKNSVGTIAKITNFFPLTPRWSIRFMFHHVIFDGLLIIDGEPKTVFLCIFLLAS